MLMSSSDSAAKLIFGPNGFRVMRPGQHVLCAVSGQVIPLEELRYWSVELQEPYASAEIATRRALEKG
ncbi:DUF2093 domain-containing protein [Altererythrobacter confluentis]|uniref:DUF2093 domain-containing protein n=1 Tax=Allopontixanthobacter confluentis TaxID=1849021 RepID=A0A6L7GK66_9SPHN|nr:DUF2093 domain-containing protein [Allopontixanthobacter confluentis]MXP15278.1 DUF2093 domain-containing protein [Allopontixanthobacter confluentis]